MTDLDELAKSLIQCQQQIETAKTNLEDLYQQRAAIMATMQQKGATLQSIGEHIGIADRQHVWQIINKRKGNP